MILPGLPGGDLLAPRRRRPLVSARELERLEQLRLEDLQALEREHCIRERLEAALDERILLHLSV